MISYPPRYRPTSIGITMYSPEALGPAMRAITGSPPASATYPAANLAIGFPFRLYETVTFVKGFVYNGATASGNWDVGISDASGARLASTGTTAQSGLNILQNGANDLNLICGPGKYYCWMAASSGTATHFAATVTASVASALGIVQMATAFVLPATLTPAAFAQTTLPTGFGIMRRSMAAT